MVKLIIGTIGVKRLQGRVSIVHAAPGAGGGKMQEKTVTPSTAAQVVTPDGGYAGLYRVNVEAAKLQDKIVEPSTGGQTVQADDGSVGLGTVTVAGAPLQAKTFRPSTEVQTVTPDAGFYGLSSVEALGLCATTRIDFTDYPDGSFTETLSDGTTVTHTVEYDSDGVPVSVDNIPVTGISVNVTGV